VRLTHQSAVSSLLLCLLCHVASQKQFSPVMHRPTYLPSDLRPFFVVSNDALVHWQLVNADVLPLDCSSALHETSHPETRNNLRNFLLKQQKKLMENSKGDAGGLVTRAKSVQEK